MKRDLYVGIDSGFKGAIVALDGAVEIVLAEVAPTLNLGKKTSKVVYDEQAVETIVRSLAEQATPRSVFVLEKASVRPGESPSSALATGIGYAMWRMALRFCRVPFVEVTPQTWQKRMLEGMAGDGKERAILACSKLLPMLNMRPGRLRNPHDGLADAGLMALYARGYGNK